MITEILVLGILGLISGLGLEIATRKFQQGEGNEKTEAVREILPGLNCGACGYAGCDQYAKEVVKDPSLVGSCVQISEEEREKIAKIIGEKVEG